MEQQGTAVPDNNNSSKPKTVMVVDDDDNWVFITKCMLQIVGIQEEEVLSAKNGYEALIMLQDMVSKGEQLPDVLFLDLKMPVMDGFEFLEAVTTKEEFDLSRTRIYMCSSSIYNGDKERAHAYSIADYLVKPVSLEQFQEIVG